MTIIEPLFPMGEHLFPQLQLTAHTYSDSVYITDVRDALKPGKTCTTWCFCSQRAPDLAAAEAAELTTGCDTMEQLAAYLRSGAPLQSAEGVDTYIRIGKAIRTFSPWARVRPIKEPKTWTITHVYKAILAGQITAAHVDGKYTDDYAYDAAINFGACDFNPLELAKALIEHPSGWHV